MTEDQAAVPQVTDELRAEAARNPGAWVYAVDPHFDAAGQVPPYGVVGAWKVDEHGEITGEFKRNPNYRPSPRALGLEVAGDPVDEAVQLAATGYASDGDVRRVLLQATVYLADGAETFTETAGEGGSAPIIAVFTSAAHFPSSVPRMRRVSFRDLLAEVPENAVIKVNPGNSASVAIPASDLKV
ncbi:type VII secretion system-associated protein [Streptomyces sp. NPDC048481]|uniref:type VII secretion system-associated protein n=1 Tax=Streptomyces sp. NPDC048481 TaxID=3365557 RepID=UPI003723F56B